MSAPSTLSSNGNPPRHVSFLNPTPLPSPPPIPQLQLKLLPLNSLPAPTRRREDPRQTDTPPNIPTLTITHSTEGRSILEAQKRDPLLRIQSAFLSSCWKERNSTESVSLSSRSPQELSYERPFPRPRTSPPTTRTKSDPDALLPSLEDGKKTPYKKDRFSCYLRPLSRGSYAPHQ